METNKAFKFELDPTEEQRATLLQHGGNIRFVWNKLLEFANEQKEQTKKFPTRLQLQSQIIVIKQDNEFLKISHSQPLQINAKRLSESFTRAYSQKTVKERNSKIEKAKKIVDPFQRQKSLEKAFNYGFPKFKRKNHCNDSVFYPQSFKIEGNTIHFPKLGEISFIKHRSISGTPKSVTITQDGDKFFVSIQCEIKQKPIKKIDIDHANIVGIDVGMATFATLSDGTEIANPRNLKKYLKKLRREQRKLSKKELKETDSVSFGKKIKVSSKNREKQRKKVNKIQKKVKNARKDFLHRTSRHIIDTYDGFALETLDIKAMIASKPTKSFRRSLYDVSLGTFMSYMEYKAEWAQKPLVFVDRFFPSTQLCSECGSLAHLELEDRIYVCPICGCKIGRDINASVNTQREGIRILRNTSATLGIYACEETVKNGLDKARKLEQTVGNMKGDSPNIYNSVIQASAFRRG